MPEAQRWIARVIGASQTEITRRRYRDTAAFQTSARELKEAQQQVLSWERQSVLNFLWSEQSKHLAVARSVFDNGDRSAHAYEVFDELFGRPTELTAHHKRYRQFLILVDSELALASRVAFDAGLLANYATIEDLQSELDESYALAPPRLRDELQHVVDGPINTAIDTDPRVYAVAGTAIEQFRQLIAAAAAKRVQAHHFESIALETRKLSNQDPSMAGVCQTYERCAIQFGHIRNNEWALKVASARLSIAIDAIEATGYEVLMAGLPARKALVVTEKLGRRIEHAMEAEDETFGRSEAALLAHEILPTLIAQRDRIAEPSCDVLSPTLELAPVL